LFNTSKVKKYFQFPTTFLKKNKKKSKKNGFQSENRFRFVCHFTD